LEGVLEILRTTDQNSAEELLKLARQGVPAEDLLRYASLLVAPEEVNNVEYNSTENVSARRAAISIAEMCDIPIVHVPAQPWTTVTDDDAFVSQLISAHFTRHNAFFPCLSRDIFVREMNSGNTSSVFCSSALMKAMCMVECVWSLHLKGNLAEGNKCIPTIRWFMLCLANVLRVVPILRTKLFDLWALEAAKVSVVNLQLLVVLTAG
jgi:hypothetical protein